MTARADPLVAPDPVLSAALTDGLRGRRTILLLMALTALGQLGVNLALPALPSIGTALGITSADTALILSTYLVGLAAGQLVVGPLSDRFGRRSVLLWGLALFTVAGALSAFALDEASLLGLRVVQGAGASAPLAIGRAVARDLYDGTPLVRVMALMTMAMAVVPGLAPALGGVLTEILGWRGALGSAGIAGLGLLLLVTMRLPETNRTPLTHLDGADVARLYSTLVVSRVFLGHALANTMVLAALYAFFAGAPRVLIGPAALTPAQFGLVPVATSLAYIAGGWALLRTTDGTRLRAATLLAARFATIAGSAGLIALFLSGPVTLLGTVIGSATYAFGLGALLPVGVAGALVPFREEAGTASALLSALQMAGGALAGAAVGWIGGAPSLAYPAVMLGCVLASLIVAITLVPKDR